MKPGGSGDAHCKRALLQNPIAFFMYESKRIPWVRCVAPLGPDYTCLANEFRPSTNQIHLDHGILLQEGSAATQEPALTDVLRSAQFFEWFFIDIGSSRSEEHTSELQSRQYL